MDIGKAFSYVFEDPEWITKVLLGILIPMIPIFGPFALVGYMIVLIRNVMAGHPRPLPAWTNLGGYFVDGLKYLVVGFIYGLPMAIFACPLALVRGLPLIAGDNQDLMTILATVSTALWVGGICLVSLYGVVLSLIMPAVQIKYAETGNIGACLRVGEVFRLFISNLGSFILWLLIQFGIVLLLPIVAMISLGLLSLPASFLIGAFSGHVYGQIGRKAGLTPQVAA